MEQATNGRSCGGCTACCFTHAIQHFDKPVAQQCGQCEVGKGCKIYGRHPQECSGYKCMWLQKDFPDAFRPDRIGLVVEEREPKRVGTKIVPQAQIWEVRPGTSDSVYGRVWVEALKSAGCVIVIRRLQESGGYSDKLVLPAELLNDKEVAGVVEQLKYDLDTYDLPVTIEKAAR